MSVSTLQFRTVVVRGREADPRPIDARLTNRGASAIRLDVVVRDLTYEGFDADAPRPFSPSELYDISFRGDAGWSVRLRVRVVDSQWLSVRQKSVCYRTRFQFVHPDAAPTRKVIDETNSE